MQETVFQRSCLDGGCHNVTDQAGGLVLDRGFSYAQLVDVVPTNFAASGAGLRRVIANDTANSLLLIKVEQTSSPYGSRMPLGKPALSAAEIDMIRDWIEAGAPGPEQPDFTVTPTASASVTPSVTATPSETATSTSTQTPTTTPSPTISPTGTAPATSTRTVTATATPSPSGTASASPTSSPTQVAGSTLAEIQSSIFNPSCLNEGCHNSQDRAGGLILETAFSYDSLVGVTPQSPNAVARGFLRVKPGDPSNSFLHTKVSLRTAFDLTFGARMPQAKPALSSAQIEQIRAWIERGALREE